MPGWRQFQVINRNKREKCGTRADAVHSCWPPATSSCPKPTAFRPLAGETLAFYMFPHLRYPIIMFDNITPYRSEKKGRKVRGSQDPFPVCRVLGYLESQEPCKHFSLPSQCFLSDLQKDPVSGIFRLSGCERYWKKHQFQSPGFSSLPLIHWATSKNHFLLWALVSAHAKLSH